MKIVIIGNCQGDILRKIINIRCSDVEVVYLQFKAAMDLFASGSDIFKRQNIIVIQNARGKLFLEFSENIQKKTNCIKFPNIQFNGFCPDYIYLNTTTPDTRIAHHSNIILQSYSLGLTQTETHSLFTRSFIQKLGYFDSFNTSLSWLTENISQCDLDANFLIQRWIHTGDFMYTLNHPKLFVMDDIANFVIEKLNIDKINTPLDEIMNNPLKQDTIFPTMIKNGTTKNSIFDKNHYYRCRDKIYNLSEFINCNYEIYDRIFHSIIINKADEKKFRCAISDKNKNSVNTISTNPYSGLSASSFWKKSIANIPSVNVEPLIKTAPIIFKNSLVATAGSCFAQHIAKTLQREGLNYYIAENQPINLSKEKATLLNYGVFSCRYGNIYTPRQLLQLIKRAYCDFEPEEISWTAKSGKLIDPYRPNIGEEFDCIEDLIESQLLHLKHVREMFENLDVFVFTLGLTECWLNIKDGSVYPVAPGVVSHHSDHSNYQFHNFSHREVMEDMSDFLQLLHKVNRKAKVLLTVSPVPLIATYENEHVLSATTYSKSVLLSVANGLAQSYEHVTYFPSYEIITGSFNRGSYFEDNLRTVRPEGVAHVMRVFMNYLTESGNKETIFKQDKVQPIYSDIFKQIERDADIICDEELIEKD